MSMTDSAERDEGAMLSAAHNLRARLPAALAPLADLATDLWWTWNPAARELFASIGPAHGSAQPLDILNDLPLQRLNRLAEDGAFLTRLDSLVAARQRDLAPRSAATSASSPRPIAFFCSEFALHDSLPIYAGGLGVLAGDILKEASDRALPMVGVGLLYHRGTFHQRLDTSGWQHEHWTAAQRSRLPLTMALTPDGSPARIAVEIEQRRVHAQVLRVQVGRVDLYLLDTNLAENSQIDRFITAQLYVADAQLRLLQYALLGIGGVRALRTLGIDPAVIHLNEGHPAFASLELAREQLAAGRSWPEAIALARERVVFTTHTPLGAGNESYGDADMQRTLGAFCARAGIDLSTVLALGRMTDDPGQPFGMTQLALRMSRSANAVSQVHGGVARAMWHPLFPDRSVEAVPIKHVTNGVHVPTWMASPMRDVMTRYLGKDWELRAADPWTWSAVAQIPDEVLWAVRCELRQALVAYVREHSVQDRLARGENLDYVERAARAFDPAVLTVGFARRVAVYKRLDLLTGDARRALALLASERPIQVVIAGKAHPRDDDAKHVVQRVFGMKHAEPVGARVVFLEDYDLDMAARLVAGCDVWLNLPRPPLEACGTSGMKAVLNGGLHLSVLDGWWHEAWDGTNGWAIQSAPGPDTAVQDVRDADHLYALLEREVVPTFYQRDEQGLPRAWLARIRASLMSLGPRFCAARMLRDYVSRVYGGEVAGQLEAQRRE
jgi:starch phosphorylase